MLLQAETPQSQERAPPSWHLTFSALQDVGVFPRSPLGSLSLSLLFLALFQILKSHESEPGAPRWMRLD